MPIEVLCADITTLRGIDAIVNAANCSLLGGGGVDGAIHRAAGAGLLEECRRLPLVGPGVRCETGQARVTGGHRLSARLIIHTVGPIWAGGHEGEEELLASCYRSCFEIGAQHQVASIAFPAISTGAYGFPADRAAEIAVAQMREGIEKWGVARVLACCFGEDVAALYRDLF
jgi:O-acetyl-ADP-ribose deacetylase (regulator of RNase III)